MTDKIDFNVFKSAFQISESLEFANKRYLTIIDYSKPSTEKRFFLIDKAEKKLLYSEYIAHGINTGANNAKYFGNIHESKKSSLGFFRTAESYNGKNGYSLRLDGLEAEINNNARSSAIVIHGAWYVSKDYILKNGRLGRSFGCPVLEKSVNKKIINLIKGGSCLFIYADDDLYNTNSSLYNKKNKF